MFKRIVAELGRHIPFTAVGAATGIVIMLFVIVAKVPSNISEIIYYTLHPAHVVFSAIVTTAMYMRYGKRKLWIAVLIGYSGSVGIATLSDAVIPYLEGMSFGLTMHLHLGFIEKWWLINPLAFLGIAIGYWKQITKLPHALHVLLSTWASLFYFTAFMTADWLHLLPFIFLFLFLAVWIPCCVSDIVYPLLFLKIGEHEHIHG